MKFLVIVFWFTVGLQSVVLCQKSYVTFESTSGQLVVCQDMPLGIIAHINDDILDNYSFKWVADTAVIRKIKENIVSVNSAQPGIKSLKFRLTLANGNNIDTMVTVNVLPKPNASITLKKGKLSYNAESIKSFSWVFNGQVLNNVNSKVINKPNFGSYRVMVVDHNGCIGSSETIEIK